GVTAGCHPAPPERLPAPARCHGLVLRTGAVCASSEAVASATATLRCPQSAVSKTTIKDTRIRGKETLVFRTNTGASPTVPPTRTCATHRDALDTVCRE